jgi:Subtilisin inhibitor-like
MVLSWCALAAGCAVLAAACGSTAAPTAGQASSSPASSSTGSTTAAAKVSLEVSFSGSAGVAPSHYTLRCEPTSGTMPDAAAACAKLLKITDLFSPPAAHVMCPMIMASAGRATVTGTYFGKQVHETILDGGCDLARWAKLKQVFS